LTSRVYKEINGKEFRPEMKKVTIKFRRVCQGEVIGPALTLGCNGGFQWIGNHTSIASTLFQAFGHMSMKMTSREFISTVSQSKSGSLNVYPAGVP
jgi:hypothetical protein